MATSVYVTGPLQVTPRVEIPEHELGWRFSRSSGPGGQGVNTTDSRVELIFDIAQSSALDDVLKDRAVRRLGPRVTVVASEFRSQLRNRESARERLAALLAEAVAPPARPRRRTKPSRGTIERRLTDKRRRGDIKKQRRDTGD